VPGYFSLKAKPGYTFDGIEEDTIRSKIPTKILEIKCRDFLTQKDINKANEEYKNAKTDIDRITALNQVFVGVNEVTFKFIQVYTGSDNHFALKTNKGYTFNEIEGDSIISKIGQRVMLYIESKPGITKKDINKAIIEFNLTSNTENQKIEALNQVFVGVNEVTFKLIKV
jgi:hypothetical protein